MKIQLIALGVSDIAKSVAFYRDQVGFDLQNQFGGIAFFAAGPITLMLNTELRRLNTELRKEGSIAGAVEIVIGVESVSAAHQQLKDRGCSFFKEPHEVTPGSYAATFTDPDEHWLTVFGPK